MKKILLTQNQEAPVDDADFEWLSQWKWYAGKVRNIWYAEKDHYISRHKREKIQMHRLILGLKPGDNREGDHINGDGLDNRRDNLRAVTHQENLWNMHGCRGYYWNKQVGKFQVTISVNNKTKYVAICDTEEEAAAAHLAAKQKYHQIQGVPCVV